MTLNCLGKLIDLDTPRVMGILNLSPDSFYDGSKPKDPRSLLGTTEEMLSEGATFIDVGGYSSRPGAAHIPEEEELQRVVPVVELLLKTFPGILVSVDTFRSEVACRCLDLGASMINDISAGSQDEQMIPRVAQYGVPYIMMHMKGNPRNMQQQTHYEDLLGEVLFYFSEKVARARSYGMRDLILDPGFGFSKTLEQNYRLLGELKLLKTFGLPMLVGLSRKSMIYKLLDVSPEEALNGSSALHLQALLKGAAILRVHDVKEAVECIAISGQLKEKY